MGATRKSIRRIFMLNGLIIGFSGTAIGIPLGYAFLWLIRPLLDFQVRRSVHSRGFPVHVQALDVLLVAGSAISSVSPPPSTHRSKQRKRTGPQRNTNDRIRTLTAVWQRSAADSHRESAQGLYDGGA
ncbi:MAG: FtsX-like permease family protein [Nitrospira sp.]